MKNVKVELTRDSTTSQYTTLYKNFDIQQDSSGNNLPITFSSMETIESVRITLLTPKDTTIKSWNLKLKIWACFKYTGQHTLDWHNEMFHYHLTLFPSIILIIFFMQ